MRSIYPSKTLQDLSPMDGNMRLDISLNNQFGQVVTPAPSSLRIIQTFEAPRHDHVGR